MSACMDLLREPASLRFLYALIPFKTGVSA